MAANAGKIVAVLTPITSALNRILHFVTGIEVGEVVGRSTSNIHWPAITNNLTTIITLVVTQLRNLFITISLGLKPRPSGRLFRLLV